MPIPFHSYLARDKENQVKKKVSCQLLTKNMYVLQALSKLYGMYMYKTFFYK